MSANAPKSKRAKTPEPLLPALNMPFEDAVRVFMGVKPPVKGKKAPGKKKGK